MPNRAQCCVLLFGLSHKYAQKQKKRKVHMSGAQAQPCDNTLPFELEILPQKLKKASTPWATHFIGKGKAMLDSITAPPALLFWRTLRALPSAYQLRLR